MPLIQSASKEDFNKNVATEIAAGKKPEQAVAIAYSVQRKNDALKGQVTLLNGDEYIDVDFDKNTVVQYKEDDNGKLLFKRRLVPGLFNSADEFWQKAGKRMKKVDRFFWSKFYNDSDVKDADDKPEYLGIKVEFAEGNTQDHFHKFVVGKFFGKNQFRELNQALKGFNELSKEQPGYNKVYFDHFIKYNGKKYKLHLGRYDAGSESNKDFINESDIKDILDMFEKTMKSDPLYRIKPIDAASAEVINEYMKVENGKPVFARLVKHDKGYSFISSKPEEDKDFISTDFAEKYIIAKNYKKQI